MWVRSVGTSWSNCFGISNTCWNSLECIFNTWWVKTVCKMFTGIWQMQKKCQQNENLNNWFGFGFVPVISKQFAIYNFFSFEVTSNITMPWIEILMDIWHLPTLVSLGICNVYIIPFYKDLHSTPTPAGIFLHFLHSYRRPLFMVVFSLWIHATETGIPPVTVRCSLK